MMGLCKSCFSTKYYGSSPDDRTADPDAQMLIVKSSSQPQLLISSEPIKHETGEAEELIQCSSAKLEKCETGDSGTCIDDSFTKLDNSKEKTDPNEEIENPEDEHEKDLVQLTVSSVASLGDVTPVVKDCDEEVTPEPLATQISFSNGLELIPESGDNLISLGSNPGSDKAISSQEDSQSSSRKGSMSAILKPIVKTRTSSFGQSCPPPVLENTSGGRQFIVNKVPSKSILTGG